MDFDSSTPVLRLVTTSDSLVFQQLEGGPASIVTTDDLQINPTDNIELFGTLLGIGKSPVNGFIDINLATEDLSIDDAGSTSATQQDWVEVTVGGTTGYIHIFAAK